MKRILAALLALALLCAAALAERYDSALGYSMELPEGWQPLNEATYGEIAARMTPEQQEELGLAGDMGVTVVSMLSAMGMEYLFSTDLKGNAVVTVAAQQTTPEQLLESAELARQTYEAMGATDAVSGEARFGDNSYAAVACTLMGSVVVNYFYAADNALYSIVFSDVPVEQVETMLAAATFSAAAPAEDGDWGDDGWSAGNADDAGDAGDAGDADDAGNAGDAGDGDAFVQEGVLEETRG